MNVFDANNSFIFSADTGVLVEPQHVAHTLHCNEATHTLMSTYRQSRAMTKLTCACCLVIKMIEYAMLVLKAGENFITTIIGRGLQIERICSQ